MKTLLNNLIASLIIFALAFFIGAMTWFHWLAYHQRFPNAAFWTFLFQP